MLTGLKALEREGAQCGHGLFDISDWLPATRVGLNNQLLTSVGSEADSPLPLGCTLGHIASEECRMNVEEKYTLWVNGQISMSELLMHTMLARRRLFEIETEMLNVMRRDEDAKAGPWMGDGIKPADIFNYIRADEVAECWDGVGAPLYARLWNDIVPLQKAIPNLEDSGPADHVGHEALASHWDKLSVSEQLHLNNLAEDYI